jgi:hypothetical protein
MDERQNMNKMRLVAAAAATALAVSIPVTSAQAADGPATAPRTAAAASTPDGNLHAWEHEYRGGDHCYWSGSSRHWDGLKETAQEGCGGMRNRATSLENRGYEGFDAVNLYWDIDQGGAWACLGRGDMWLDLSLGRETFSHKSWFNHAGYGESLQDNISSHQWVESC